MATLSGLLNGQEDFEIMAAFFAFVSFESRLNDPTEQLTVLAPTDEAILAQLNGIYGEGTFANGSAVIDFLQEIDEAFRSTAESDDIAPSFLEALLGYHVVERVFPEDEDLTGRKIETLLGETFKVREDDLKDKDKSDVNPSIVSFTAADNGELITLDSFLLFADFHARDQLGSGEAFDRNFKDKNDFVLGSDLADNIKLGSDDDWGFGDAGNDTIAGGGGKDSVAGDEGEDLLRGGKGRDQLFGGDDADTLLGGKGRDTMDGGSGGDSMSGGKGSDSMFGGSGEASDMMSGGVGDDTLDGDDGDDTLDGDDGDDALLGGSGDDMLDGGKNRDTLDGGEGDDTLTGGGGKDQFVVDFLAAEVGDDVFTDVNFDRGDRIVVRFEIEEDELDQIEALSGELDVLEFEDLSLADAVQLMEQDDGLLIDFSESGSILLLGVEAPATTDELNDGFIFEVTTFEASDIGMDDF